MSIQQDIENICLHASPFLLTTACEHLQTEQASCWTCGKGMCVPCLLCRIFSFTMDQMFSFGERSELQMDWTQLCNWCSLALFYWKMFGLCQKRSGQEYLLDFSALVVPVQTCKLPNPPALITPIPSEVFKTSKPLICFLCNIVNKLWVYVIFKSFCFYLHFM